jgi:hypothetical protein
MSGTYVQTGRNTEKRRKTKMRRISQKRFKREDKSRKSLRIKEKGGKGSGKFERRAKVWMTIDSQRKEGE